MQGGSPTRLSGEEASNLKFQADLDGILVNYASKVDSLAYVGEDTVRDKPAHKFLINRPDGPDVYIYLDAESMLEVKTETQGTDPMSGARTTVESYLSDYRELNGVQWPYKIEVYMGGQLFNTVLISSIQPNVEIKDDLFVFPGQ